MPDPIEGGAGVGQLPAQQNSGLHAAAALESLARIAAQALAVDCALVCFRHPNLRWLGSAHCSISRWSPDELDSAVRVVDSGGWLLVADTTKDSRFRKSILADRETGIRCYAGAPIPGSDGRVEGTLCVLDRRPGAVSSSQLKTLGELARLASSLVRGWLTGQERFPEHGATSESYRKLFEKSTDIVYVHDLDGRLTAVNRTAEAVFGYSRTELLSKTLLDLVDREYSDNARQMALEQYGGAAPKPRRLVFRAKDGHRVALDVTSHVLFDLGRPVGLMGFARSQTAPAREGAARKRLERRLHSAHEELGQPNDSLNMLHRLAMAEYLTPRELFTDFVASGCKLLETPVGMVAEVHGSYCKICYSQADGETLLTSGRIPLSETRFLTAVRRGNTRQYSVKRPRKRSPIYAPGAAAFLLCAPIFRGNRLWGVLAFASRTPANLTEPRLIEVIELLAKNLGQRLLEASVRSKTGQDRLSEAASREHMTDSLTGLPNARSLRTELGSAILAARRSGTRLGAVLIGLDRFKQYNDALGRAVGDRLLRKVGERLRECLRQEDLLGRLEADRFLYVIRGFDDKVKAERLVRSMLAAIGRPFFIEGLELFLTASAGISLFPRDAEDVAALLWNADAALSQAKRAGRGDLLFFSPQERAADFRILELENALRGALDRKEFRLRFQPQIEMDGSLVGLEALLEWRHAKLGQIPPRQFIPVAEETGVIVPIGKWVLDSACRQMAAWRSRRYPKVKLAVNVSAVQFTRSDLAEVVAEAVRKSDLEASSLELEITESAVMRDVDQSVRTMTRLRDLGVRISIDDFGTGYSSLSYLRRLPADTLKIDRSFLDDVDPSTSSLPLIDTIVSLAHSLGLSVVGEGVENLQQFELLREAGCDRVQGHLFCYPVNASRAGQILRSGRKLAPQQGLRS